MHALIESGYVPAGSYALHGNPGDVHAAYAMCRGSYQRSLISGCEALSGATLRGAAKKWSGRYAASAGSLIRRCRAAGINVREATGSHNKRLLVVG